MTTIIGLNNLEKIKFLSQEKFWNNKTIPFWLLTINNDTEEVTKSFSFSSEYCESGFEDITSISEPDTWDKINEEYLLNRFKHHTMTTYICQDCQFRSPKYKIHVGHRFLFGHRKSQACKVYVCSRKGCSFQTGTIDMLQYHFEWHKRSDEHLFLSGWFRPIN